MTMLDIYRSYLVSVAKSNGRPFRLPNDTETLKLKPEYKLFKQLEYQLKKDGIEDVQSVNRFMTLAMKFINSDRFHITLIINEYKEILKFVNTYKEPTNQEICRKIDVSFSYLEEYVLINNISKPELMSGSPPLILKFWKNKQVDDHVIVSLVKFTALRQKPWFSMYCNYFSKDTVSRLREKISANPEIFLAIKRGRVKLEKSFKI